MYFYSNHLKLLENMKHHAESCVYMVPKDLCVYDQSNLEALLMLLGKRVLWCLAKTQTSKKRFIQM